MLAVINSHVPALERTACCAEQASASTSPWVIIGVIFFALFLVVWVVVLVVYDARTDGGNEDPGDGGGGSGGGGPKWPGPLDPGPTPTEPEWWPEFEQQFAAYVFLMRVSAPTR